MDDEKDIRNDKLRDLMRSLPSEPLPAGLNARIMECVRQEKSHLEKRSERQTLIWTIVLAAVVLGMGVWTLYAYIDWDSYSLSGWAETDPIPPVEKFVPANYSEQIRTLLPFAGIVLFLLLGDSLLRRRAFMKHNREN